MDLQDVMKLLELMEARHLEEIEVEQGDTRIRLRKGGAPPVVVPIAAAPAAAANPHAAPAAPDAEKTAEANLVKITSPMVGTFYRAASPDAEPFINEGDHVTPEQVPPEIARFLRENMEVVVTVYNQKALSIEVPAFVSLKVIETAPGLRGDTVSGASKPATVETGAVIQVPLFINEGDVLKVDTRTGTYVTRA